MTTREYANKNPTQARGGSIVEAQMRPCLATPSLNKQPRNTSNLNPDNQYYANPTRKQPSQQHLSKEGRKKTTKAETEPEDFFDEEDIPTAKLAMIRTLTENSIKDWPQKHSRKIRHML